MFKTFANWSDFLKKTVARKIYVELSNGYFVPVSRSDLKRVADSARRNEDKFCGSITYLSGGLGVQIKLS